MNKNFPRSLSLSHALRFLSLGALIAILACGCIRRSLTISSEPSGAGVYVNDRYVGTTPLNYDFLWYGGYRVELRKDGYERLYDRRMINAPPFLWIPLDLFVELMPFYFHDNRRWEFALLPIQYPQAPIPPEPLPKEFNTPIEPPPGPELDENLSPSEATPSEPPETQKNETEQWRPENVDKDIENMHQPLERPAAVQEVLEDNK